MPKIRFSTAIDLAMPAVLLPLMGYSLIGEAFHEAAGAFLLLLIAMHVWGNRTWLKCLAKGHYGALRCLRTACNVALAAAILAQGVSGMLMSGHAFPFLSIGGAAADARSVHLCAAYWCFTLMAMHAGMHLKTMLYYLKKRLKSLPFSLLCTAFVLAGIYGARAFFARGFSGYMLLQNAFAFFDFDEPVIFFLADYAAIFCCLALSGHLAASGLARLAK